MYGRRWRRHEVYTADINLMPIIPKRETIRKIMNAIGFKYTNASKAKSYVETTNITKRREEYIGARYSRKYADAIFVWQDESYVHHHHVWNKAWFNQTRDETVLRKGKGRRYVIVHAGCAEYGWIGEPRVWVSLYFSLIMVVVPSVKPTMSFSFPLSGRK